MPADDGKRLMHAHLTINGALADARRRLPRIYGGPRPAAKASRSTSR